MIYRCDACGAEFDKPVIRHYTEDMNGEGAWEDYIVTLCPVCSYDRITEEEEDDENA